MCTYLIIMLSTGMDGKRKKKNEEKEKNRKRKPYIYSWSDRLLHSPRDDEEVEQSETLLQWRWGGR